MTYANTMKKKKQTNCEAVQEWLELFCVFLVCSAGASGTSGTAQVGGEGMQVQGTWSVSRQAGSCVFVGLGIRDLKREVEEELYCPKE